MQYYEIKLSYTRNTETEGKLLSPTSESYIVQAEGISEAEVMSKEFVKPYVFTGAELVIKRVVQSKVDLLLNHSEGRYYYKAKVGILTVDERTGKERINPITAIIRADQVKDALLDLEEEMEELLCDYRLISIQESSILDIITSAKVV